MKQITINEAIKMLTDDKTAHKVTVYFAVGTTHQSKYNLDTVKINGVRTKVVPLDAGKTSNIKQKVLELATESLMGGIWA
jgi:hypothetical protein